MLCPQLIRWGLTGTVPKEKFESVGIVCSIGPVINKISAKEYKIKMYLHNACEYPQMIDTPKCIQTNSKRIEISIRR